MFPRLGIVNKDTSFVVAIAIPVNHTGIHCSEFQLAVCNHNFKYTVR